MDSTKPLIIQWLLSVAVVTEEEALITLKSILRDEGLNRVDIIPSVFSTVREELRPYSLEIRRIFSFEREKYLWVVYNTTGDRISQMAFQRSPEQVDFFKRLLRSISESKGYQASLLEALVNFSGPLNKKQCEDLIERFVADQWLAKGKTGKLIVGPRTIVELELYLKEEELFEECAICNLLVTSNNLKCNTSQCTCRVHESCFNRVVSVDPNFSCALCDSGLFELVS